MHVLTDILGSIFIGGLVLLLHFGLVSRMNYVSTDMLLSNLNGSNTVELSSIVEYDFNKIAYRDTTNIVFESATKHSIKFKAGVSIDSLPKTIYYYLDTTKQIKGTENPNDRALYRQVSGKSVELIGIVTEFTLNYLDSSYTPMNYSTLLTQAGRDKIKGIDVYLKVESSCLPPSDETGGEEIYPFVEWRKTIYPKNL